MFIPKFLIKLHRRIKDTLVWRNKWKILSISPFVIAGLITVLVFSWKTHTKNKAIDSAKASHSSVKKKWIAYGQPIALEGHFPAAIDPDKNILTHNAYLDELRASKLPNYRRTYIYEQPGFAGDDNLYFPADHYLGKLYDINSWLDPPQPQLNRQDSARLCLAKLSHLHPRLDHFAQAVKQRSLSLPAPSMQDASLHPYFAIIEDLTQLFHLRAILYIHAKEPAKALEDILTIQRCALQMQSYPCMLGLILQVGFITTLEAPVTQGIASHCWDNSQLQELDKALTEIDLRSSVIRSLKGEVTFFLQMSEPAIAHLDVDIPQERTFSLPNDLTTEDFKEFYDDQRIQCAPAAFELHEQLKDIEKVIDLVLFPHGKACSSISPSITATILTQRDSMYLRLLNSTLLYLDTIPLIRVALAAERYRLKYDHSPRSLSSLIPGFLPTHPIDNFDGTPLKYRLTSAKQMIVYSVGPDGTDHGGDPDLDQTLVLPHIPTSN